MPIAIGIMGIEVHQQELEGVLKAHLTWYRLMAYIEVVISPDLKKAHKPKTPESWIPFPWEDKPERKKPLFTPQQAEEIFDRINNSRNGRKEVQS